MMTGNQDYEIARNYLFQIHKSIYESDEPARRLIDDSKKEIDRKFLKKVWKLYRPFPDDPPLKNGVNRFFLKNFWKNILNKFNNDSFGKFEKEINNQINSFSTEENSYTAFRYNFIESLLLEIRESCKSYIPENFILGTLETGRVNGLVIRVPNSTYKLLLIESGLFTFANLICKSYMQIFDFDNQKGNSEISLNFKRPRIKSNHNFKRRYLDAVLSYVVNGNPNSAEPYLLEEPKYSFASTIRDGFELFIISHELGHLIEEHLDKEPTFDSLFENFNIEDEDVEGILTDWMQEIQADIIGARIVQSVFEKRNYDPSIAYLSIEIFFGSIEILERVISILRDGNISENISKSHPPFELRRKALIKALEAWDTETSNSAISIIDNINNINEKVWNEIKDDIFILYEKGMKPHSMWENI